MHKTGLIRTILDNPSCPKPSQAEVDCMLAAAVSTQLFSLA